MGNPVLPVLADYARTILQNSIADPLARGSGLLSMIVSRWAGKEDPAGYGKAAEEEARNLYGYRPKYPETVDALGLMEKTAIGQLSKMPELIQQRTEQINPELGYGGRQIAELAPYFMGIINPFKRKPKINMPEKPLLPIGESKAIIDYMPSKKGPGTPTETSPVVKPEGGGYAHVPLLQGKVTETPLKLFHGSDRRFGAFDLGYSSLETGHDAIWLTPSPKYASQYGKVKEYRLKGKNVFDTLGNLEHRRIYDKWVQDRINHGEMVDSKRGAKEGYADDYETLTPDYSLTYKQLSGKTPSEGEGYPYWTNGDWLVKKAKENGFDAVITSDGNGEVGIGVLYSDAITDKKGKPLPNQSRSPGEGEQTLASFTNKNKIQPNRGNY